MAKKKRDAEQKKRRGLLASLFEPADGPETENAADEPPEEELIHLFDDDEVEYSDEQDAAALSELMWDDGEHVVDELPQQPDEADRPRARRAQQDAPDGAAPDAEPAGGEPPIRLFDGEEAPPPRGSRTRLFRTGSGTAARINVNETETLRSIDAAKRRQREEDARRQHEAYVRRQKRQKRRQRAVRRMAVNAAFVAFIVVAVLAALYFTFLLDEVVVVGNETYASDYIVELSGLQLGRHMLLCDLEAPRAERYSVPALMLPLMNCGIRGMRKMPA